MGINLFIPLRQGAAKGKLSPNTISGWLKQSIQLAHDVAGKEEALRHLHSVRADEIRALSAKHCYSSAPMNPYD